MIRTVLAGAAVTLLPAIAAAQQAPELSFGAALTSNYIFRGTPQSGGEPAVQAYAEGSLGDFYLGAWGSTVKFGDDQVELNLYVGFRSSAGGLDYDFGYVRYIYDESGDCCGEAYLALDYGLGALGSLGGALFYDLELETSWAELRAGTEFGGFWAADGSIGTDFGSLELGGNDKVAWNVGVTRSFGALVKADLRYHDSNYDPGRLVATLVLDF
jgi:uncharacterized protein (TIGR02001 family)